MNNKTKDLEKVSFGIGMMFGIYWIYSCFIKQHLSISNGLKTVIGLLVLYGVGLGLFAWITNKIPSQKLSKKKISCKTILLCLLLQFSAIWVLTILVNVSEILGIGNFSTDINATSPYMLFMLLIFNPIIEEFVFRKMFADKLIKYGERFYILVSSFCFAIVHGVSLGIPQIVYTFILGILWSYLMVKTGDLKLVIIMHALSNLFGSVVIQVFLAKSMVLAGMYSMLLIMLGIIGFILFMINKKQIILDGSKGLFKKATLKDVFSNKGIIFYLALTVIVMILK